MSLEYGFIYLQNIIYTILTHTFNAKHLDFLFIKSNSDNSKLHNNTNEGGIQFFTARKIKHSELHNDVNFKVLLKVARLNIDYFSHPTDWLLIYIAINIQMDRTFNISRIIYEIKAHSQRGLYFVF